MKKTLLALIFTCLIFGFTEAQVTAGQVDDFEDDTVQGWIDFSPTTKPVNVSSDGPAGGSDSYLMDTATGLTGSGGRLVMFNDTQWLGDYTTEGIIAIRFNARAVTNDIDIRISMTGDGGKFSSSTFVTVVAGTGWTTVTIPIGSSDLVSVSDGNDGGTAGFDVNATLGEVSQLRILSNPNPAWRGEFVNAEMHVDNIEALTSLSVDENKKADFSIYPNPSRSKLNISLAQHTNDTKIEVYDILGKRIHAQTLTNINTSINVSRWNAGVYLVKITNKTGTQTKRFVKE